MELSALEVYRLEENTIKTPELQALASPVEFHALGLEDLRLNILNTLVTFSSVKYKISFTSNLQSDLEH
jgi:hypothetical protein